LLEDSGKTVQEAVMQYRGVDRRILSMNSFLKEEVLALIQKTSEILKGYVPPDHVDNKNKCRSCQFKDVCYDVTAFQTLLSEVKNKRKVPS